MSSYVKRFAASVEEVYKAIPTEKGIKSWWTVDCDISTEIGVVQSYRFQRLLFNSMKLYIGHALRVGMSGKERM